MIQRFHPRIFRQSPLEVYNLLFLGQGFAQNEFENVVNTAWSLIKSVPPFNLLAQAWGTAQLACAVYYDSGTNLDLKIRQAGNVLSIPMTESGRLANYLSSRKVPSNISNISDTEASLVWPSYGRVGRQGSLVAVIIKGNTQGELYEIASTDNYPIPMVAVVQTGNQWHMPLVRGFAQTLGGLVDEYELDSADHDKVPEGLWFPPTNILFLTDDQRTRLDNGEDPFIVVPALATTWPVSKAKPLQLYKHDDPGANPLGKANGEVQLVVGGGGYRQKVLRSDFDCLMRRIPSSIQVRNSTQLPIQDQIFFCAACRNILTRALSDSVNFDLPNAVRTTLDSQHLLYDIIGWTNSKEKVDISSLPFSRTVSSPVGDQPSWSCTIEVNTTNGLRIINLQLRDRPGDPFAVPGAALQAAGVMESIEFTNSQSPLSVTFDNDPAATPLNIADAFANQLAPPKLELATDGGRKKEFKVGMKLTLSWAIPDKCTIEVAMSLVLKGMNHDIDPGGAAMSCKIYPQMSMRFRRPPKGSKKRAAKLPTVKALEGTITLLTNNVIPSSMAGALETELKGMANDTLSISFFTDSNSSEWDNKYKLSQTTAPSLGGLLDIPKFGVWTAEWQSGRKLASVEGKRGGTALAAHRIFGEPGLPHWSWLFDYASPLLPVGATKRFTAVYRKGEKTADNKHDGGLPRSDIFPWPLASDQKKTVKDFEKKVLKVGRQGAYDNVHVHADMRKDSQGRPLVAAPFCADVCLHLHWRWGTAGIQVASNPYSFLGWGTGKGDQGAHTTRGAPLIPPNQHLDVEVSAPSASKALVKYTVNAADPKLDKPQVFLEQGIGFAFTYGGLTVEQTVLLAAALGAIPMWKAIELSTVIRSYNGDFQNDPVKFDREVRMLFQKIYENIRWFDQTIDDVSSINVQQIQDGATGPNKLEDF